MSIFRYFKGSKNNDKETNKDEIKPVVILKTQKRSIKNKKTLSKGKIQMNKSLIRKKINLKRKLRKLENF